MAHLKSIVDSPCIEVALTKVVEGRVSGYYGAFRSTISHILDDDQGCDGWWVSPLVENPQHQLLMINWKSVDVRHSLSFSPDFGTESNAGSRLTTRSSRNNQLSSSVSML